MPRFMLSVWARRRPGELPRTEVRPRADVDLHQSTHAYMAGGLQAIHNRPETLQPGSRKLLHFVQPVTADSMHDIE